MRFGTSTRLLGLTALALIAGPFARAQETGWYAGADIGRSKARIDDARINSAVLGQGFGSTSIQDNDQDTGFKAFAGYEFNRTFSLEGGYFNIGQFGYKATTVPAGTLNGDIKVQGLNLDPVFSLPITNRFSAFVRAGAIYARAKDSFSGTGFVQVQDPSPSKSALSYKFGGGLQYDITRTVGMRVEAERYRINDAVGNKGDIDMYSVGLVARFGRHAPASAPVAEASPVVQPPPVAEEAPVLVVVPVKAATQEYCTILDLEFTIDTEDIRKEDKEKLAVLGTYLTRYPDTTAIIEGHSDNVGTREHNMKLSQSRADNVVDYLVSDLHIDRARLSAVGYADTRPIADNATDEGKRRNRRVDAIVACVTDVQGLNVASARMTMALYIDFDQNEAAIKPEYDGQLRRVADFMNANPAVTATVEGHTGNLQTTPAKAMAISVLRARNVVDYLAEKLGISRDRMTTRGFGDKRRVAYNTSVEGEQENRRVNIIFTYPN